MKKLTVLLITTAFLSGCGNNENESMSEQEPTTEVRVIADEMIEKIYDSVDEFKRSMSYDDLKEQDVTVYDIAYDTERYVMDKVISCPLYYEYILYDSVEEQTISFSVTYDKNMLDMNRLQSVFEGDKNILTTATNSTGTHEVYLLTPSFMDEVDYGLTYLPFEKYVVSIYAGGNNTSSDEILSYFDDFELVPEG